ncbi:MAG: hypothetical protein RL177_1480 [Bacteroidota bacterium]
MPESSLKPHRDRIDHIDKAILDLLKERNEVVKEVLVTKIAHKLPIFVAGREDRKIQSFREEAVRRDLDADWAEDFLRMIMSASRASQSTAEFPMSTLHPKTIVFVGGGGGMGTLFARHARSSGHVVRILDRDDWSQAETLCAGAHAVVITVPIHDTIPVIRRIAPFLPEDALLADFTSNKSDILAAMLESHPGPVVGLHPMHGPDVHNLSKQLMMVCPGRDEDAGQWLLNQFQLWGMRLVTVDPTASRRARPRHAHHPRIATFHRAPSWLVSQSERPQAGRHPQLFLAHLSRRAHDDRADLRSRRRSVRRYRLRQ